MCHEVALKLQSHLSSMFPLLLIFVFYYQQHFLWKVKWRNCVWWGSLCNLHANLILRLVEGSLVTLSWIISHNVIIKSPLSAQSLWKSCFPLVLYPARATYPDYLLRTRNDLAEALELLKAQVDSNVNQDRDQIQAGPRSTSPTQKDAGVSDERVDIALDCRVPL